jgi:aspartate dehydrogenase
LKVGLIGYGAMARSLCRLLATHAPHVQVTKVLIRPGSNSVNEPLAHGTSFVFSSDELLSEPLDVVIECAGHSALSSVGPAVLKSGTDLLIASVGALADAAVEQLLYRACKHGGSKLRVPAGAIGGLDVLCAAKLAGIESVVYSSKKHPNAWKGTLAESLVNLSSLTQPVTFFEGDGRSAALKFPQNANVAALISLSGIGFEQTKVSLTADPFAMGNTHTIHALGSFGEISITINGKTLPDNPKTSMLAPLSLVRCLLNMNESVVIG